jgi:hypothetical protein
MTRLTDTLRTVTRPFKEGSLLARTALWTATMGLATALVLGGFSAMVVAATGDLTSGPDDDETSATSDKAISMNTGSMKAGSKAGSMNAGAPHRAKPRGDDLASDGDGPTAGQPTREGAR